MNYKDLLNNLNIEKKIFALNALESQYRILSLYTQNYEEINLYLELVARIYNKIPLFFKHKHFEFDLLVENGGPFQQEDKHYNLLKFKNSFDLNKMVLNSHQYEDKEEFISTLTDVLSQQINSNINFSCSAFKYINLDNTLSYITFKQDNYNSLHNMYYTPPVSPVSKKIKKSPKAASILELELPDISENIYEKLKPISVDYKKYDSMFKVKNLYKGE